MATRAALRDETIGNKPTLKLIKRIFGLIDENVYGNYILKSKRRVNFIVTPDIIDDSTTRLRNGEHYMYINPTQFQDYEGDKLALLINLIESESVIIALDIYNNVKKNSDRSYDLFGLRRKCVAEELFGKYLHVERIPSKEIVWFQTDCERILEGKVVEHVKNEQYTIIKAKDGSQYTIGNDRIYGSSRDDYFVV
jgi:hypothetical protein